MYCECKKEIKQHVLGCVLYAMNSHKKMSVLFITRDLLITNNNLKEFKCFNSERRDSNLGVRKLGSCGLPLLL